MNKARIRRKLKVLQRLTQPNKQQLDEQAHLERLLREKEMENNPLLYTPTPKNFLDTPYIESDWS